MDETIAEFIHTREILYGGDLKSLAMYLDSQVTRELVKFMSFLRRNPEGVFEAYYIKQIMTNEWFRSIKEELQLHYEYVSRKGLQYAMMWGLLEMDRVLNFQVQNYNMQRLVRFFEINGVNPEAGFDLTISRMDERLAKWWVANKAFFLANHVPNKRKPVIYV